MKRRMTTITWLAIAGLLIATVMLSATSALAQTDPQTEVITIYFAGTGLAENWWESDNTKWGQHEELLATLYHNQVDPMLPCQNRKFIDGIGSVNTRTKCTFQQSLASIDFGCRTWGTCLEEATEYLQGELEKIEADKEVILNLVGFSRGAILTMLFAHKVQNNTEDEIDGNRITRINILAIDPVSGELTFPIIGSLSPYVTPENFCLGERVKQYVGIYATDERTMLFAPTIPAACSPDETDVWTVQLRGSHETLVGNVQKDGHFADDPLFLGYQDTTPLIFRPDYEPNDPSLGSVYDTVGMIAVELLGSKLWGSVSFNETWVKELYGLNELSEDEMEEAFCSRVGEMNDLDHYDVVENVLTNDFNMRMTSFLPGITAGLEWYDEVCIPYAYCWTNFLVEWTAWELFTDSFLPSGWTYLLKRPIARTKPRIIWKNDCQDGPHTDSLLREANGIPLLVKEPPSPLGEPLYCEDAWKELRLLGYGTDDIDADEDGVQYAKDNCPGEANPKQEDYDYDGIGDKCDPCPNDNPDDIDGDGICAGERFNHPMDGGNDNCPDVKNDSQSNKDEDEYGDECDDFDDDPTRVSKDDKDKVDLPDDNCPYLTNDDQSNADGDEFGDKCDLCPDDVDNDIDHDGICGGEDNCPDDPNPGQENTNENTPNDQGGDVCDDDADGDDVANLDDNCPLVHNPAVGDPPEQPDFDGDGVGDACECDCDNDGDGWCPPEDCNDDDRTIHPGATDYCGDGIDQNCYKGDTICVALDIKPGSCPNPLNAKGKGVLPVAILGDASFDVGEIDPESVTLFGVSPLRWTLEDVGTPYEPYTGREECGACTQEGWDGYIDLTLNFSMPEIVEALNVEHLRMAWPNDCVPLILGGSLYDGTAIHGEDLLRIRTPAERRKLDKMMAELEE